MEAAPPAVSVPAPSDTLPAPEKLPTVWLKPASAKAPAPLGPTASAPAVGRRSLPPSVKVPPDIVVPPP